MPDVGLFSATEPLPKDACVVIKYSVEVEGLPVYTETYDVRRPSATAASGGATRRRGCFGWIGGGGHASFLHAADLAAALETKLAAEEKADLVAFLRAL